MILNPFVGAFKCVLVRLGAMGTYFDLTQPSILMTGASAIFLRSDFLISNFCFVLCGRPWSCPSQVEFPLSDFYFLLCRFWWSRGPWSVVLNPLIGAFKCVLVRLGAIGTYFDLTQPSIFIIGQVRSVGSLSLNFCFVLC